VPELVLKDDKGFLGLNYSNFTPVLVNSIQEFFKKWRSDSAQIHAELQNLKAKNEKLEKENLDKDLEIKKLKKQSAETNARLDKIESLLKHK
jgi:predicted  nucleic acid-binding Zn-ribbon protein